MHEALLNIPNGTLITLVRRGKTISGCLVYNPVLGRGRLIDVDAEVTHCFSFTEVTCLST